MLVVDDQEPMRLLLAQLIGQDLEADITLAGTCEGALRHASQNNYDVIVLDLLMPGIGGFEVLKRIRTDSANKSTPVVIVSILAGGGGSVSAERAMALGADAVVPKPVKRGALIAAIKTELRANV